jgi:CDP-diacylglycerol---glycerol-3-phosphate 3-phosphatidyltransferase
MATSPVASIKLQIWAKSSIAPLLCLIELREIPAWSVFLILFRELTIAGWRVQQIQISGANLWGKAKTVSQIAAIALLIAPLTTLGHTFALVTYGLAVSLTLISGGIYLWPKSTQI